MEIRNPAFNAFGTIDCEINHPVHGWIPFTASPDDPADHGKAIYAAASQMKVAEYVEPEPEPEVSPDSVSARQFKMQLAISGLTETVEGWIGQQDSLVQIAYAYSSAFVKSEPMMQAGFAALGFTEEQIDAFFLAASKL